MLAYKFTEKDLHRRRFAWNKLIFYMNYFHQHLPEMYPGLLQTSKIEIFVIIIITAKLSILENNSSPGYTSDLRAAAYETLFRSKVKFTLLRDSFQ